MICKSTQELVMQCDRVGTVTELDNLQSQNEGEHGSLEKAAGVWEAHGGIPGIPGIPPLSASFSCSQTVQETHCSRTHHSLV